MMIEKFMYRENITISFNDVSVFREETLIIGQSREIRKEIDSKMMKNPRLIINISSLGKKKYFLYNM